MAESAWGWLVPVVICAGWGIGIAHFVQPILTSFCVDIGGILMMWLGVYLGWRLNRD